MKTDDRPWREQFRDYLRRRIIRSDLDRAKTHMTEIFRMIEEGLGDFARVEYASLTERRIHFADGKTYVIRLEELRAKPSRET